MSGTDPSRDTAFDDLLRTSPDAIVVTDEDGTVLEFNTGAEAVFGWTRNDALGASIGALVVPERLRGAHDAGMARLRGGAAPRMIGKRVEMQAMRRDGEEFPCEVALSTFRIQGRQVIAAIMRDISALRSALDKQQRAAAFLQSIFDDQTEVIFRFDADYRLSYANDAALRLYGVSLEDFLGQHLFEDVDPAVASRLRADLDALTPENPTVRAVDPKRFPNGALKWIDWTNRALFNTDGGLAGYLSVGRDVTEQRASEIALAKSEARFNSFMRNAPIGMYLKDSEGRYMLVNPEMAHVFGRAAEEAIGLRAADLFAPSLAEMIEAADDAVRRTGQPSAVEQLLSREECDAWRLVVRFPLAAGDSASFLIGGFDIDITQIKAAEKEVARTRETLYQSEKLSALGAFAAGVAHELNNPLMILAGQAAMLAEEAATGPLSERAAMIERVAERCGRIAQSFLSIARRAPAKRVAVDLANVIDGALDMAEMMLRNAGITVEKRFAAGLPRVMGDPDLLHQVMLNLILNAQQAMATTRGPCVLTVVALADEVGRAVCLDVSDTGPGVPLDQRERVFEPFFTTRAEAGGTGLGLSSSRTAIEQIGGRIDLLHRTPGATFRITLSSNETG